MLGSDRRESSCPHTFLYSFGRTLSAQRGSCGATDGECIAYAQIWDGNAETPIRTPAGKGTVARGYARAARIGNRAFPRLSTIARMRATEQNFG